MKKIKSISTISFVLLSLFLVFSCSSRDEDVQSKQYTAKLSVHVDANYALGYVSYTDPVSGTTKIEYPDNINKEIVKEFKVVKGYKTNVDINMLGLDGNLKVSWTITDSNGNTLQNFNKNVYREQKAYKEQYTDTL